MKLWGGRFEGEASTFFEKFSNSLHFDRKLVFEDIEGSRAFAQALLRERVLTPDECRRILEAFSEIADEAQDPRYFDGAEDEDIHTFVIRKLGEKVGPVAEKMHTGRSRNEQVSLDLRLYLRSAADTLLDRLGDLMSELLALARKYPDAVIPGFTHLRRAQPVLWPHYLLAFFEMFARDCERVRQARERIDVMPLGSGALAGSGFPFDREALAQELGFRAISRNSMDASGDRDFALDFLYGCSVIMLHLSRLAEDWILYSSEEFNWITLGDGVTSGSSLMPQKKNPDSLELIRGKSGRVFGSLTSLFVTIKGLPMTYNRDLQEDKETLFEAFDHTSESLAMAKIVAQSATLNPGKALAAVEESWAVATDLAEELARNGVSFHRAHQIVGRLVLESLKAGKKPGDWTGDTLAAFAPEFKPEMARLLAPSEGMEMRELPGGTGAQAVRRALEEAEQRLKQMRESSGER
ncbi:MAG: argininosuccinate lyase [Acidobacteriaceae bacterium]|nr:argininosuccinate lyase [Acidobacteriaceae bacterium]MBV9779677.1 argininosuccinate lyase [Acidobacteriaceae bacterium]